MTETGRAKASAPLPSNFRVHFQGGATVFLKSANSTKAEQEAIRQHPGIVTSVKFMGKAKQ